MTVTSLQRHIKKQLYCFHITIVALIIDEIACKYHKEKYKSLINIAFKCMYITDAIDLVYIIYATLNKKQKQKQIQVDLILLYVNFGLTNKNTGLKISPENSFIGSKKKVIVNLTVFFKTQRKKRSKRDLPKGNFKTRPIKGKG